MRLIDLEHDDPVEGADLATVRELMETIEASHTDLWDFELTEPGDGSVIFYASMVLLSPSQARAWVFRQPRRGESFYLGVGNRTDYYSCIYHGAPEELRADCLLSLEDALAGVEQVLDGKALESPFHWVRIQNAMKRDWTA